MNYERWYLVYTLRPMEILSDSRDVEIPLEATTKYKAIAEAKTRWIKVVRAANNKWKKQKATLTDPPKTAFGSVHPNPRVIYRISLS